MHQNGASPTTNTTSAANNPQQQQHVVNYHVHQGEVISLQLGDGNMQVIPGRTLFLLNEHYSSISMCFMNGQFLSCDRIVILGKFFYLLFSSGVEKL
jgi:hypothetical protein